VQAQAEAEARGVDGFRAEVRAWLEANYPASLRHATAAEEASWGGRRATYANPDAKLWLDRMGAKGWTTPTWPREYGGGGLSREQAKVLGEEMRRLGCRPPLFSFGISMLGPVLLEFASEEQKREHIPRIVRGEIRWCQGYSEPGAGSDLASLQMRAVRDGDHFVVNGQKIWTSYADHSDWIFCLVRTRSEGPKHDGISFLLIDMETPGVSTAPIKLISGSSPFCQTFLQEVRVPVRNLVGPEGGGWNIAKRLLQHERSMISEMGTTGIGGGSQLEDLARRYLDAPSGPLPDPLLRDRVAQVQMDSACFALTLRRSADTLKAGRGIGPESSMFKYYGTELNKRRRELAVAIADVHGLGWEGAGFTPDEIDVTRDWLRSRGNSIEGGTSEVQLNIIAKRVLGLPD
jgi:alkylation response protein AidB-like acyl-CoA dehydrogenase